MNSAIELLVVMTCCRLTKKILIDTKSSVLFVATDKEPMIQELEEHLQDLKVLHFVVLVKKS